MACLGKKNIAFVMDSLIGSTNKNLAKSTDYQIDFFLVQNVFFSAVILVALFYSKEIYVFV